VRVDYRWGASDAEQARKHATELVALAPDVLVGTTASIVAALQQATRTVPIVFAAVIDPVGAGLVASLARPGGNTTGFTIFEYGMSGKWLELLKQIAPPIARVAILRDPTNVSAVGQLGAIQVIAPSFGVELRLVEVREAAEIDRAITTFAQQPNGGLIILTSSFALLHRKLIIDLAARLRVPAIYPYRFFVADGGLISYGPNLVEQFRQAAGYLDRIFKGEKAADLPVQTPTKYEMVLNLKTAKALSLTVPPSLLARADEVIE
jgi:putative ABC transport system substrate-binding protein